ncbi:unnamed protein product, partial [Darwinula stevensoni]
TFFPQRGEVENKDLQGILLFSQGDSQHITILPVVPQRRSGDIWMAVDKLPKVYKGVPPSSSDRIFFRGKIKVTWQRHTITMLWSMDRQLAGLPPISPGTFFPQRGEVENKDLQGILLFSQGDSQHITILPVVPQR